MMQQNGVSLEMIKPTIAFCDKRGYTGRELYSLSTNGVEWVVDGVIPKGYVTFLYGDSGIGKSLLAMHLAVNIASGAKEWFNTPTCGRPLQVAYCDYELSGGVQSARYRAVDPDGLSCDNFYFLECFGWLQLDDKGANWLAQWLTHNNKELVIIDSFGMAFDNAFEEPDVARTAMHQLQSIASKSQAAVVVVHHINKSGSMAGGAYLKHSARSVVSATLLDRDATKMAIELKLEKANFADKAWIRNVVIEHRDGAIVIDKGITGQNNIKAIIVDYVYTHGEVKTSDIVEYLQQELDDETPSKSTVERTLRELATAGLVKRNGGVGRHGATWSTAK